MGAGGGPEAGDKIDASGDRSGETDAVVGAVDVVVHRLGMATTGNPPGGGDG